MKYAESSLIGLEGAGSTSKQQSLQDEPVSGVGSDALWGEVAAAAALEAASRHVAIELEVEDGAERDPEKALRVYKNLVLAALRLTARDACLRVRVARSGEEQRVEIESVYAGAGEGRVRLYRGAERMPSEAGFALQAARAFTSSLGGSIEAQYMANLGVHFTLRMPHRVRSSA